VIEQTPTDERPGDAQGDIHHEPIARAVDDPAGNKTRC
jgi:hypothetical protein